MWFTEAVGLLHMILWMQPCICMSKTNKNTPKTPTQTLRNHRYNVIYAIHTCHTVCFCFFIPQKFTLSFDARQVKKPFLDNKIPYLKFLPQVTKESDFCAFYTYTLLEERSPVSSPPSPINYVKGQSFPQQCKKLLYNPFCRWNDIVYRLKKQDPNNNIFSQSA